MSGAAPSSVVGESRRGNWSLKRAVRAERAGGRAAFTLLELVLVMLLITTALAIAAPSLSGFFGGSRQRDTAMQLTALLRWARTQAVSDGRVYRVNLADSGKTYFVTCQEGEQFVQPANMDLGRQFQAPDRVAITLTRADGVAGDYVDFYPDGRCEPGEFKVTLENRDDVIVKSTAPTEQYRQIMPAEAYKK